MYIVSAVILGVIIFGLASKSNFLEKKDIEDDFDEISENYIIEGSEIINYGVNKEKNLFEVFNEFSDKFLDYSGGKDDDLGVLYVLNSEEGVKVKNCLKGKKGKKGKTVRHKGKELKSCFDDLDSTFCTHGLCGTNTAALPDDYSSSSGDGKVVIDGIEYDLEYEGENPRIGYVIIKEEDGIIKVNTNAK